MEHLARLHGIETSYLSEGEIRAAKAESVREILRALGVPADTEAQVRGTLRHCLSGLWRRVAEPVYVLWGGAAGSAAVRLPAARVHQNYACRLRREDGAEQRWSGRLRDLPVRRGEIVEGRHYVRKDLPLPEGLPPGYHRLEIEIADESFHATVIASPVKAFPPRGRGWGVFLPLFSLHRRQGWPAGDLGDLQALMDWTGRQGGSVVGTLPLLSRPWELRASADPYAPSSRLFLDEFYLDLSRCSGIETCRQAQQILSSRRLHTRLQALRKAELVDYAAQMGLKRPILEALAEAFFSGRRDRTEYEQFLRANPEVRTFALFRAACRREGKAWPQWPSPRRDGRLRAGDGDERDVQYCLYTQWQLHRHATELSRRARGQGVRWYLDLPVGVSGDGYDAWRWPDIYVRGMSIGAPPDAFFAKQGQNWGLLPLNPRGIREDGYGYLRAALSAQMQYAGVLRLDHVMGLHRQYWVPDGASAVDGVYVNYPMDELLAVVALESWRHRTVMVGENLGTVAEIILRRMDRHRLMKMYVMPYEIAHGKRPTLRPPHPNEMAMLNTHDLPPLASFWAGKDLRVPPRCDPQQLRESRRRLCRRAQARRMLRALLGQRTGVKVTGKRSLVRACLEYLGRSRSKFVLVNLEDLWFETHQQNRPASGDPANWRRRARYDFEDFSQDPAVLALLASLAAARKVKPSQRIGSERRKRPKPRLPAIRTKIHPIARSQRKAKVQNAV